MDGHRCHRCGNYWASQAGPPLRFQFITHFCPNCLPLMAEPCHLDPAPPPPPRIHTHMGRPRREINFGMDITLRERQAG